jgi:hypothetical protein
MKLSNIRLLGRYTNTETGKSMNVYKGRNSQRGTTLLFYLYRGSRVFIADSDFYSDKYKSIDARE